MRLGQRLAGVPTTDADVEGVMDVSAAANQIDTYIAYYPDVHGDYLDSSGNVVATAGGAAEVGGNVIHRNQGVMLSGTRGFPTVLRHAMRVEYIRHVQADATAVTGRLQVASSCLSYFPIDVVDCENKSEIWNHIGTELGAVAATNWRGPRSR